MQESLLSILMSLMRKQKKSDNPQDVNFVTDQMRAIHTGLLDKEKNDPALAYSIKTGNPLTQAPTTLIIQGDSKALNIVSSNIQKWLLQIKLADRLLVL